MDVLWSVIVITSLVAVPLSVLAAIGLLIIILRPSRGQHSVPVPVMRRIIVRESMQLADDEGWSDGFRAMTESRADALWADVVPLHGRRERREHELSRAA